MSRGSLVRVAHPQIHSRITDTKGAPFMRGFVAHGWGSQDVPTTPTHTTHRQGTAF